VYYVHVHWSQQDRFKKSKHLLENTAPLLYILMSRLFKSLKIIKCWTHMVHPVPYEATRVLGHFIIKKKWGPILFSHFVGILLGLIVQPLIIIIVLKFSSARRVDLGSGRFGAETRPGWRKNKERKNPVWPGCLAGWPYKTRSKTWL